MKGLPDIVKHAERVTVALETAVAGFPRLHRYTHGSVLRLRAMDVWESTLKAWRRRDNQAALIESLSEKIDSLKLAMQLGHQINAFRSKGEFVAIYKIVRELGAMCGGWKKHVVRQNSAGQHHGLPERPLRLGARAASTFEAQR